MAAVTSSPPPLNPPSPTRSIQRKPMVAPDLSPERYRWSGTEESDSKPSPLAIPDASKMRAAPVSPVRLSFRSDNWAQPPNVSIEGSQAHLKQPTATEDPGERRLSDPAANGTLRAGSDKSPQDDTIVSDQLNAGGDNSASRDGVRRSRDTDTSSSTQQMASTESSVATNASSVSQDVGDSQLISEETSPEESVVEDSASIEQSVPQLQYHHQESMALPRVANAPLDGGVRPSSTVNLNEQGVAINRHLTPNSAAFQRRSSMPRPQSSYSVYSDLSPRGRSPGLTRKSPDGRPASYAELLNVPYPQPAPAPITIDNSQLRTNVGNNASLLSTQKTLEMYRQNVKKTNDPSIQYSFAIFIVASAQEQGVSFGESPKRKVSKGEGAPSNEEGQPSPAELVREAKSILTRLANGGYPFAQYYLADGYASGLFNKGKEDYNAAFPLFILAAKHGHAESAYRAGLCYEFGWGCRKDPAKAIQYLRTAASKTHPGAMTRLGKACLAGDFGETRYREGIKWLKRATEHSDAIYNAAPYQLGTLYETGYGEDIFKDESYAAELFTQAAELGHPEASFRMGDAYEHGKLNCPRDPALSVHFYTGAAEGGHAGAMMGLCAWYLVGAEPILEKDEEEAYEWARRSAELGFVKAQYTVGYFTEMGIGCRRDILEANVWYVKAADAGDQRATLRLAAIRAAVSGNNGTPMEVAPPKSAKMRKNPPKDGKDDKDCVVM
ncbi:hypothetical protein PG994_010571 [Apiospora phragmitis]|uniref:Protoplast regeneration and killer toxin resistance protein n=1 Tax=Apiospora phragmitis TaxID=2905665 RepID=A0ABR1TQC8_9PEZI